MPKTKTGSWVHYKKGDEVKIRCYKKGCEDILMTVILGEEYKIHPSFMQLRGVGRLHWRPNAKSKRFELGKTLGGSNYCSCKKCQTQFGGVIIISRGRGKNPIIFGYGPESA
ncbi:MAG: hypothetical protein WCL13_00815 [bacterium]